MPFLIPLAASDWGDLIFLVIVLAGGLIQWLTGLKRKQAKPPESPDPFGGPRQDPAESSEEPSWDDLMDALGQKPGGAPPPVPAPPVRQVPVPQEAPPPLRPIDEPTVLSTPFRNLEDPAPAAPALSEHLKTLLAAMDQPRPMGQSATPLTAPKTPHQVPVVTGHTTTRFSRLLREPGQVRRAVVLQEILQPPLALR